MGRGSGGTQSIKARTDGALNTGLVNQTPWLLTPLVFIQAGLNMQITQDLFSFVSTTSALDAPASTPLNTVYVFPLSGTANTSAQEYIAQKKFTSDGNTYYNQNHTDYTARNALWIYNEMESINQTYDCDDYCSTNVPITGPDVACIGTYLVPFITGATYTWSVSPSGTIITSDPNSPNSISISAGGNYDIYTISVLIENGSCTIGNGTKSVELGLSKPYPAGPFDPQTHVELFAGFPNVPYYFQAMETNTNFGPFTYTWTITPPDGGTASVYYGQTPTISFPSPGYYSLHLKKKSTSCLSTNVLRTVVVTPNYGGFAVEVTPNPASGSVEISYTDSSSLSGSKTKSQGTLQSHGVNINIYDRFGVRVIQKKEVATKTTRMNISTLPNGVYIVEVIDQKGRKGSKRLVVQH